MKNKAVDCYSSHLFSYNVFSQVYFSKGNNFRKLWTNSFTVVRSAPGLLPSCHLPSDALRAAGSSPSPISSQGTTSKQYEVMQTAFGQVNQDLPQGMQLSLFLQPA